MDSQIPTETDDLQYPMSPVARCEGNGVITSILKNYIIIKMDGGSGNVIGYRGIDPKNYEAKEGDRVSFKAMKLTPKAQKFDCDYEAFYVAATDAPDLDRVKTEPTEEGDGAQQNLCLIVNEDAQEAQALENRSLRANQSSIGTPLAWDKLVLKGTGKIYYVGGRCSLLKDFETAEDVFLFNCTMIPKGQKPSVDQEVEYEAIYDRKWVQKHKLECRWEAAWFKEIKKAGDWEKTELIWLGSE